MLDTGLDFYERHCDDCVEWGIPRPPAWEQLTVEQRAGWELQAAEHAMKMLEDRREST